MGNENFDEVAAAYAQVKQTADTLIADYKQTCSDIEAAEAEMRALPLIDHVNRIGESRLSIRHSGALATFTLTPPPKRLLLLPDRAPSRAFRLALNNQAPEAQKHCAVWRRMPGRIERQREPMISRGDKAKVRDACHSAKTAPTHGSTKPPALSPPLAWGFLLSWQPCLWFAIWRACLVYTGAMKFNLDLLLILDMALRVSACPGRGCWCPFGHASPVAV